MNNIPNKQIVRFLKLRYIFSAAILFLFLIVVLYFKTVNSLVIPLILLIEFTGISVIDHKIKRRKTNNPAGLVQFTLLENMIYLDTKGGNRNV